MERYPPTALELLRIQGLGPKSIRMLWETYRVSTIDDLERICQEHKLRDLPRMGAKLEEKVLKSIASYRQRAGRFLLSFVTDVAQEIIEATEAPSKAWTRSFPRAARAEAKRRWAIWTCW